MPNPLGPIWDAYLTALAALKVVKRCATVSGVNRAKAFSNTRFAGLTNPQCIGLLDAAQTEVDDAAVLALYAAFEARVRDHVVGQAHLLHGALLPSPAFGVALAGSFAEFCERNRMDNLAGLFTSAVGPSVIAQLGTIRAYRHWLAHGRRGTKPPIVAPRFAYQTLTAFLQSAGLT